MNGSCPSSLEDDMARSTPTDRPMASHANQYIREILHTAEAPPPITVRYFYSSPLAIDDPLSPLPPPAGQSSAARRHPARPFSAFDNEAINTTWLDLRKKILKHNEELGEKLRADDRPVTPTNPALARLKRKRGPSPNQDASVIAGARDIPSARPSSRGRYSVSSEAIRQANQPSESVGSQRPILSSSSRAVYSPDNSPSLAPNTTGNPFIRAPSRGTVSTSAVSEDRNRPMIPHMADSYNWDDDMEPAVISGKDKVAASKPSKPLTGPFAKVTVGVSRLHHVVMDTESIRMEPIYWSPVNDIASVVRGTWFYKDTMMPVEVDAANMLEAGYLDLQPWTQTWADELNSAEQVGAPGEVKILHMLWPEKPKKPESRPATSRAEMNMGLVRE